MATDKNQSSKEVNWEILPYDFQALARSIIIVELRAMIRRLQENGNDFSIIEVDFEKLDLRALKFLKREFRDTLRTLGGGR